MLFRATLGAYAVEKKMGEWRNRQTQRTQNPSGATPWEFDSPLAHYHA